MNVTFEKLSWSHPIIADKKESCLLRCDRREASRIIFYTVICYIDKINSMINLVTHQTKNQNIPIIF